MNSKTTKRALLSSVVALFICFSMLLGTTFAWFTDTVTSAGNVIQSGTLDVDLVDANGKSMDGQVIDFVANDNRDQDEILWEPGCTYKTEPVKVVNKGNLALKYQIAINGINGDAKLLEAIEWSVTVGGAEIALDALNNTLLPGAESGEIVLAGHMKEEAGNEYQNLKVEGVSITVYATQLTNEKDSFDNQYDKMATIDNIDELNAALADDYDLIVLGANIELDESLVIPAGKILTIDLCGYKLYQAYAQTGAYAMIDNNGNLTIKDSVGTGKISYADIGTGGEYASNTISNKGVLTINGGTIENTTSDEVMNVGYPHAIDCYQGSTTTINGGTVKSINYDSIRMFCNSTTLATKVVINGGTIVNRVSFQNPNNNTHTPGYGILEINGGNFVTTDGVNANVRLLNFSRDFSNMKATVTGGTFDKGFKTQDYANCGVKTSDWLNYNGATAVATEAELQEALDNAVDGDVIMFINDITGNVTATAKENVAVTIDGNDKTLNGTITVDGKTATIRTSAVTIKNVKFIADTVATEACVNMGVSGNTNTRYICNLTVEDCYFNVPGKVAVKSYDNGDKNLKITGCTVAAGMHSLLQVNNVAEGLLVENCKVYSKNGINTVQSEEVTISGCEIDVLGYAVRFGASSGGTGFAETYKIENCTLKSACEEAGDAVIILRGTADNSTLTITNTTIVGTPDITNTATNATVIN